MRDRNPYLQTCPHVRSSVPTPADWFRHYLLAGSNINLDHTRHTIDCIQLQDVAKSIADCDTNVDAFLRHNRERCLLEIIESRKRQAQIDFESYLDKHTALTWEARLKRLADEFGLLKKAHNGIDVLLTASSGSTRTFEPLSTPLNTSLKDVYYTVPKLNDIALPADDDIRPWDAKAQTFSQAISSLNEHRLIKQPVAICSLMSQLERSLSADVKTHQMADSWQILAYLVDEKHVEHDKEIVGALLHPRTYHKQYSGAKEVSVNLKTQMLDRSRRYLENQFFLLVEREVARNPQEARLGGSPTPVSKIKGFVNIRFSKHGQWTMPNFELINGSPVWVILFFLLRAGFLQEAVQYSHQNELYLTKFEKNWCSYISAYAASPDRVLPRQLAERLQNEFDHRIKFVSESTDPFKHALYKIIGRCDLSRKTLHGILSVTEDWMWLQLSLAREADKDEPGYQHFDLGTLQSTLAHYGPRHFSPKNNALLYFQVLLLSGQFERAVHYLASHSWTDAVHFAVILSYYGLLRVASAHPEAESQLLVVDEKSFQINFAALLQIYAKQIQSHSAIAAVEYLSLICLNTDVPEVGVSQRTACHASIRAAILQTRDFTMLLGDIRTDGAREPGFIEKRLPLLELKDERQYLRAIIENAAAMSEQEGRISDAILLYHLSEEYDTVVGIINDSLGESLLDPTYASQESAMDTGTPMTSSDDPAILAQNLMNLYIGNASIYGSVTQQRRDSLTLLLSIVTARKKFSAGKHDDALTTIEGMGVLPLEENATITSVKNKSHAFDLLDDCVARNIPGVMLLAVECMRTKYHCVTSSTFTDQSKSGQLASVRRCARNISVFAGILKYSISEDVRIRLEESLVALR